MPALDDYIHALEAGDADAVVAALAPDVVLVSDGGGKATAALRPIVGADKVARFSLGIAAKAADVADLRIEVVELNGGPGVVAWAGTEAFLALSLVLAGDRVEQVLAVRNPDKLAGLRLPVS